MRILKVFTIVLVLLSFASAGSAEEPMQAVQGHVNKVLEVLRDKSLKDATAARKEKIRKISNEMFDYPELSKRTLAQNWKKLNEAEQKEFIDLYRQILENAYINKLLSYKDEQVNFTKEKKTSDDNAEVSTRILTKSVEIPIDYRVIKKEYGWKVYDVVIEGVSLVSNYRTQFKEILMSKSNNEFLDILRKKASAT